MDFKKRNYYAEFIQEEIAEKMNCSVSTVNRINRTMRNKIFKASDGYYRGISKTWK